MENAETKKKAFKPFRILLGLIEAVLLLCILAAAALFAYKKIAVDYSGSYARDRLVYTKEYGFCLLIEYHPEYRVGKSNGFAVVRIPWNKIFSQDYQAKKDGKDSADSEELYSAYKLYAIAGDNTIADSIVRIFNSKASTISRPVGSYGNYVIIPAEEY